MVLEYGKYQGNEVSKLSGAELFEAIRANQDFYDGEALRQEKRHRRYESKTKMWQAAQEERLAE